jgi:hypothetical protein
MAVAQLLYFRTVKPLAVSVIHRFRQLGRGVMVPPPVEPLPAVTVSRMNSNRVNPEMRSLYFIILSLIWQIIVFLSMPVNLVKMHSKSLKVGGSTLLGLYD